MAALASSHQIARKKRQRRAHEFVAEAKRIRLLKRQPCKIRGDPQADAHHEDYSRPLVVEWLCERHHTLRHHEISLTPSIRLARRRAPYMQKAKTAKMVEAAIETAMRAEQGTAYLNRSKLAQRQGITVKKVKRRGAEGVYRPIRIGPCTILYNIRHIVEWEVLRKLGADGQTPVS